MPKNKDEVRSLVGFVNYYGRFFKNLSAALYPSNRVLQKDIEFKWSYDCEKSLREVKQHMQSDVVLRHFDLKLRSGSCP